MQIKHPPVLTHPETICFSILIAQWPRPMSLHAIQKAAIKDFRINAQRTTNALLALHCRGLVRQKHGFLGLTGRAQRQFNDVITQTHSLH